MSEASLDAREIGAQEIDLQDNNTASREAGQKVEQTAEQPQGKDVPGSLLYHKKGHSFYKSKYYSTKSRLTRARLLLVALGIVLGLVGFKVTSLGQENSALEDRISELERSLYYQSAPE